MPDAWRYKNPGEDRWYYVESDPRDSVLPHPEAEVQALYVGDLPGRSSALGQATR
jgi:hypothetical protein